MSFAVDEQTADDWPELWAILAPVFREGRTYPLPRDVCEAEAKNYWIKTDGYNGVARDDAGARVGAYYLRPDQGGPGNAAVPSVTNPSPRHWLYRHEIQSGGLDQ